MPLVYGQDQRVADWVGAQCYGSAPTVDAAIGYELNGELRAGVYFDAPTPNTIFAHVASTLDVAPRRLVAAVFAYVFRQLGMERLTFLVSGDNVKALELVQHLGARYEGALERAFGKAAGVWFVLWATDPVPRRYLTWLDGRKETPHGQD